MKIFFKDNIHQVTFGRYLKNNIISIHVGGNHGFVASVNLPDLDDDEVAIKDYSENTGMLNALLGAGVINKPHRHIQSGFVLFPVCTLTARAATWL